MPDTGELRKKDNETITLQFVTKNIFGHFIENNS